MSNISLEKTSSNSYRYSRIFTSAFSCFRDASARRCEVVAVAQRCSLGWRFTYSRCSPPSRVSSGPRETTSESGPSESEPSESEPSNSSSESSRWGPEQQTWTWWSTLCCSCHCFHMSILHVWHLSGHRLITTFRVCQSISGLCSWSQVNPRMTSCFLRLVTVNNMRSVCPLYQRIVSTISVIDPASLQVPSTLKTGMAHCNF